MSKRKIIYEFPTIKNKTFQHGYDSLEIVDGRAEIDPDNKGLVHMAEKWLGGKRVEDQPAAKAKTKPAAKPSTKTTEKGSSK